MRPELKEISAPVECSTFDVVVLSFWIQVPESKANTLHT